MRPTSLFHRLVVFGSVAALVVSACGTAASPAPASVAPASAPAVSESAGASAAASAVAPPSGQTVTGASCQSNATVVNYWTSHTPPDSDTLKKIVDAFNTANPDICVKMTIVPGSETDITKLLTSIRGGVGPDVYEADRFTVPQRAAEGVLAELTNVPADLKSQELEFAWNETQFQGKTYALPLDTDARALWYNKDLLQKAGVDPATLDISKGAPTIDDVVKIGDKVTQKDSSGNYTVMGFLPFPPGNQGWHYTWGFAYGGKFADLAACKVTPTDPGVEAGFQFLYDWSKAHDPQKVQRWISTNLPPNFPTEQDPFLTGKLAMEISGDWTISQVAKYNPSAHYGFTFIPVPKAGDKPATWAGGWSEALIPGSKVVDQATKFILYMTGPDGQKVYAKDTTHLPTLKPLLSDTSLFDPEHAKFLQLLSGALSRPPLPVGAEYWDALTTAMNAVTLNTQTPADALKAVADKVNPDLQQFCPLQ